MLVSRQSDLIDSLVVGKDVNQSHVYLEVSNTQLIKLQEGVVYHIQKLRLQRVKHKEYLSVCLVLVFPTHSISKGHSNQVWNSCEWIFQDLYSSVGD